MSILLLDIDDVLCLNRDYGGHDLRRSDLPSEFWERIFSLEAVQVLNQVMSEFAPFIVVTSSWLSFLDRRAAANLFSNTGLSSVANRLHINWDAPQFRGETRARAIDRWLSQHRQGAPYVIIDDTLSGTGLTASPHHRAGRVVLCRPGIGLQRGHLPKIASALSRLG